MIGALPHKKNIRIKDFVVPRETIQSLGYVWVDEIYEGFNGSDIVLVMNNHYQNNKFSIGEALGLMRSPALFFDGWNMFNQHEIESFPDTYYATMGYITER